MFIVMAARDTISSFRKRHELLRNWRFANSWRDSLNGYMVTSDLRFNGLTLQRFNVAKP